MERTLKDRGPVTSSQTEKTTATPLATDTVVARHPDVAWQRVDGELVLLDCRGRRLLGLNSTAARAWELIDGHRTLADIARVIAGEFGAPQDSVASDLVEFATTLVGRGLAR
jgi:hypothetical protein